MLAEIDSVLQRRGGVAAYVDLRVEVSAGQVDGEIRRGRLVRVFDRAYCRPWDADLPFVHDLAALVSVGAPAMLSHRTALHRWGLLARPDDVDVTIPHARVVRSQNGLQLHRTRLPSSAVIRSGMPIAEPATALVTSWASLASADRRGPTIEAVRQRLVSPTQLSDVLAVRTRAPGRRAMTELVTLLAAGCESELELWGHVHVFDDVPGLRHGVRQKTVTVRGRVYRLDLAFEAERLAVEMDGRQFHASDDYRERDTRRDADLATIGWQTLRFTHRRLHQDAEACRAQTLAALAARRSRDLRLTG